MTVHEKRTDGVVNLLTCVNKPPQIPTKINVRDIHNSVPRALTVYAKCRTVRGTGH